MSKPSASKRTRRARRKAKQGPRRRRRPVAIAGVQVPSAWADDRYDKLKIHWSPVGEATCSCCAEPVAMGRTDQTECDRCEAEHKTEPERTGPITITDSDGRKL